jgi:hypothetical protein
VILADLPMVKVHHFRGAKWVSLPYMDYCPPLPAARPDEERLTFALRLASATVGVRKVEARTAGGNVSREPHGIGGHPG